jgi:hypothetical protein
MYWFHWSNGLLKGVLGGQTTDLWPESWISFVEEIRILVQLHLGVNFRLRSQISFKSIYSQAKENKILTTIFNLERIIPKS